MTLLSAVEMGTHAQRKSSVLVPMSGGSRFELPSLPYAFEALEPHLTARTMGFHYSKHHRAYLDNLNALLTGTPWLGQPLEDILLAIADAPKQSALFNNAAQAWNHAFFWQCMAPSGGGPPSERIGALIKKSFGSREEFNMAFVATALAQFGSGWVWLVQDGQVLSIVKTANADTPIAHGAHVLLTCDVWEHAYYLDYQNRRKDYVQSFLDHLVNWTFAESRLQ
jgi:superoxide dismutase, Fe-Mn family